MKYFLSSRRGSVLIEAALVMPLLVLILFTLAEFGEAFTIKRRNAQIASTAADLVSQVSCVSASQTGTPSSLQDIATIASIIMQPYSYSGSIAGISVTSVAQTGGNALIQWSWATGTLTPGTAGGSFSMPPGLFNPSQTNPTVIVAQTSYKFVPVIGSYMTGGVTFTSQAYNQPRTGSNVALQTSC